MTVRRIERGRPDALQHAVLGELRVRDVGVFQHRQPPLAAFVPSPLPVANAGTPHVVMWGPPPGTSGRADRPTTEGAGFREGNHLVSQPWKIMSIGLRDWAHRF